MNKAATRICVAVSILYAAAVLVWFVLYRAIGDGVWWLALINVFAPYLFLPLAVLIPLALACRRWALWVGVVLPSVLFLALYGPLYLPPWPLALAESGSTLMVMTFNVKGDSEQAETVRLILDHGPPDVVALQELSPSIARLLLQELEEEYPYHTIGATSGYWGMGVLSRYPLAELRITDRALPRWMIQAVEIEAPGGAFTLYNVHPPSTHTPLYASLIADTPRRVRTSFDYRYVFAEKLLREIDQQPGPVIVAGDLNSTERSDMYRLLTRLLADAHRAAGWGMGHTFPAQWGRYRGIPYPPRVIRIDMILTSDAFVPLRSYVGASGGESDHRPVVAELSWRER